MYTRTVPGESTWWKTMMHALLVVAALAMPLALSACNTMEGAGEDIEAAGENIEEAAED